MHGALVAAARMLVHFKSVRDTVKFNLHVSSSDADIIYRSTFNVKTIYVRRQKFDIFFVLLLIFLLYYDTI